LSSHLLAASTGLWYEVGRQLLCCFCAICLPFATAFSYLAQLLPVTNLSIADFVLYCLPADHDLHRLFANTTSRLTWAKLQPMSASLQPNMSSVAWAGYLLRWKVWAAGSLLRLAGHDKAARKLDAGVESFFVHNNPKLDRQLAFSTPTLLAVEAALVPEDAAQYMLVWRPSSSMRTAGSVGCGSKAISSSLGRKLQGGACSKDTAAAAAELESKLAAAGAEGRVEGCGAQGCAEGASAAMQGDISWKRYLHTQMAGVYSVVFGQEVPQQQPRPAAAAVASGASKKVAEQQYIVHNFRRIK
jgi:hypothetical protein